MSNKIYNVLFTGGSGLLALNWAMAIKNICNVTLGLHEKNLNISEFKKKQINLQSVDNLPLVPQTFGLKGTH